MAAPFVETTSWAAADVPGQREFTRAIAHWLDDEERVHDNCLQNALRGFEAIASAFLSALRGTRLALPADIPDDVVARLEEELGRRAPAGDERNCEDRT